MTTGFNSYQRSLVLTETIATQGVFPPRPDPGEPGGDVGGMTMAMLHTYAFNFGLSAAPLCAGQLLPISQNTALFSLIGTTYGGDGRSTFALPDLRGATAIGDGQGPGLAEVVQGEQLGAPTTVLTPEQMPSTVGGSSAPIDDRMPELGLKYMIHVTGTFEGGDFSMLGTVVKCAATFAPPGYMECAGQLLPISEYEALFTLIGTTFGGDGETTFALPDLRGRTVVGAGSTAIGTFTLGEVFGQDTVSIGTNQLPVAMGGGGQAFDNSEPSLVLNYIISLQGIFPSREGGGADFQTQMLGEVMAYVGQQPPRGWAFCAGQLLPINQNQALFALLGTMYGGDGRTNFALPDLRGRDVISQDNGFVNGQVVGSESATLTLDNIPGLTYNGTDADGTHYGGNGDDHINALDGQDSIIANGGNDDLTGGAGNDTVTAGDGDDVIHGGAGNDSYDGGIGSDTVSYAGAVQMVTVDLSAPSNQATGADIGTDQLANIENATGGSGRDNITGNALPNVLNGGGGADRMSGLAGDDWYYVDNAGDVVIEDAGQGTLDRVFASVSWTLTAGAEIENFSTTSNAGTAPINLTGNELANLIYGNAGDNILDGKSGADRMIGMGGNDWYYVDNAGDTVADGAGQGTADRVFASVSWTLTPGAEIENLSTMNNSGTAAINLTGNELANLIYGNAGNNILDGRAGADHMIGLGGNDWYDVDNAGDVVTESAGQGTADRVFASVSWTLTAGAQIENLSTSSNAGTAAINLTGNELANTIYGNAGNNILDGNAGADQMLGMGGNDSYYVDNAGDMVTDNVGQGTADRVLASTSWTLTPGAEIENLSTDHNVGTGAINLTGNELANLIFGNAGNNILDGKAGADRMIGLTGNDSYYVDNTGDVVTDTAGQGTADRVFASVSWTLTAGAEIENLATSNNGSTAAINLAGNELANLIYGNAGSNTLDGRAAVDRLIGMGGNDTFVFRPGEANGDTVYDFVGNGVAAGDSLRFVGYGAGATFTQNDAMHWQVNYNGGASHDIITFANAAAIHASDLLFA